MNIETLWQKIKESEGKTFYTVTGLPFTYKVVGGDRLQPIREGGKKWVVTKDMVEKALTLIDGSKAEFNRAIIAPSYVYGILTDSRISE